MSKVERFEDLKVWQMARELCKDVHKFTLQDPFSKDFKLVGQINASSGSIMDTLLKDLKEMGIRNLHSFYLFQKDHQVKPDLNSIVQSIMGIFLK